MLNRLLIGLVGTAVAGAPIAAADPAPLPDLNAYPQVKPSEYAVQDGAWYAFTVPNDVTCVVDKQSGGYGCSGAIPAAPGGANTVTAAVTGTPGFASASRPLYGTFDGAKPLPPNTRLSFRTVTCGTDGTTTSCVNAADQSGFVISPTGSYTFG